MKEERRGDNRMRIEDEKPEVGERIDLGDLLLMILDEILLMNYSTLNPAAFDTIVTDLS